jgi:hypothetical protein
MVLWHIIDQYPNLRVRRNRGDVAEQHCLQVHPPASHLFDLYFFQLRRWLSSFLLFGTQHRLPQIWTKIISVALFTVRRTRSQTSFVFSGLRRDHDEDLPFYELFHSSLDERNEFEALSYTWGDTKKHGNIRVDGRIGLVTRNLSRALADIRSKDSTRVSWVDALCIGQGSGWI